MIALPFAATRFDGRSAAGEAAFVRIVDNAVEIFAADDGELRDRAPLARVAVSESFERTPCLLVFADGVTVEVIEEARRLREVLATAVEPSPVVRLQQYWPAVIAALALLIALSVWGYASGVPAVARWAANAVSPALEHRFGERVLALMDETQAQPSKLPTATRERLTARFAGYARRSAPGVPMRVEFRDGRANAFALPGGIIVVYDGLVEIEPDDDAIMGVLGHELGHVVHRHATRQLFQATGVVVLASLLWGDLSAVAANAPTLLGILRYSRDFEREADQFALDFMRANDVPVQPLYRLFVRLQSERAPRKRSDAFDSFLSTHPSTEERLELMQQEIRRRGDTPSPDRKDDGGSR